MTAAPGMEAAVRDWFAAGAKPVGAERIGVEVELFCFDRDTRAPVPHGGPRGVEALLGALRGPRWSPVTEGRHLVGLAQHADDGTSCLSLEPGCQLEFSGRPVRDLHQLSSQLHEVLEDVRAAAAGLGIGLLPFGYFPSITPEGMPRSPEARRQVMEQFLAIRGPRSGETMYCTAAVQANVDYHDEADFCRKLRVAQALQPLATALFAASPFRQGHANGLQSNRADCWRFTDAARTGALPFAFRQAFGFQDYIDHALGKQMVAVPGEGGAIVAAAAAEDLRSYWSREGAERSVAEALAAWHVHNSFLYPQVRLKPYLELRGADCSPLALMGVAAFWTGLLYDVSALAEADALVSGWSLAEWSALADQVPALGLSSPFRGQPLQVLASRVVGIARSGLARRGVKGPDGEDEGVYLAGVSEVAESGISLAQRLAADHQGAEDLKWLFDQLAL